MSFSDYHSDSLSYGDTACKINSDSLFVDMEKETEIYDLIDRLTRVHAASLRSDELNPTQMAALGYLARANRFSRSPSQVADYLSTTRGTVSQTLKALIKKGYVLEKKAELDRRVLVFSLTDEGAGVLEAHTEFLDVLAAMGDAEKDGLQVGAKGLLSRLLARRQGRSFGLCRSCKHHQVKGGGMWCGLLEVPLQVGEDAQICHEHIAA